MEMTYEFTLEMRNYIANPRWPETSRVIEVMTKSGAAHPKLKADNRQRRLVAYLETVNLTSEQFEEMQRLSERKWYRTNNHDLNSEIVLPVKHLEGCVIQAIDEKHTPRNTFADARRLRSVLKFTSAVTDRRAEDGLYDHFVKPKESNAAREHIHHYIGQPQNEDCQPSGKPTPFVARGKVTFDTDEVKPEGVESIISASIRKVGLGACRKMGFGLGRLVDFRQVD